MNMDKARERDLATQVAQKRAELVATHEKRQRGLEEEVLVLRNAIQGLEPGDPQINTMLERVQEIERELGEIEDSLKKLGKNLRRTERTEIGATKPKSFKKGF